MALKLKWKNPNKGETTVDIYRGDSETVDLTTPLVTLENNETEWIDNSVLFGNTYYYVWAVNSPEDRVVSRPQKIEVSDRRGPGSNVLSVGNEDYGYFGNVLASDFINTTTLLSIAKNKSGITTSVIYPVWHKFIRHGKVVFVPDVCFGDHTWTNLYNAGFIFGTNDNGPEGAGEVNQFTTFELNGDLFVVRAPTGFPDGVPFDGASASYALDNMPEAEYKYSEFEDFFYPLVDAFSPLRQRMVNVAAISPDAVLPGVYNSTSRNYLGVNCQEFAGNYVLQRGAGYDTRNSNRTRGNMQVSNRRSKTDAGDWWPVIEYVGRVDEVDLESLGV